MAYPTDPRSPAGANASTFVGTRLTAEDAERLAATFRPSWELDQAPFTGPGSLSEADVHALRSEGTHADVRAAVQALNGTHAPAPATVLQEPPSSVIIDPAVVTPEAPPVAPPMLTRTLVLPASADPRVGMSLESRNKTTVILPRTPRPSLDSSEFAFAKRSRTGLWFGLSAAALVVVGVGLWLASSSGDKPTAPIPSVQKTQATAESRVPPPPPPRAPETVTAAPPPPAPAPPPPPTPTVAAPVVAAPPPAPAAPPAPPVRLVVPPAPRPPTWNPPAARPPARPKGGATIVRDVPF
jgi:hypothetical protein